MLHKSSLHANLAMDTMIAEVKLSAIKCVFPVKVSFMNFQQKRCVIKIYQLPIQKCAFMAEVICDWTFVATYCIPFVHGWSSVLSVLGVCQVVILRFLKRRWIWVWTSVNLSEGLWNFWMISIRNKATNRTSKIFLSLLDFWTWFGHFGWKFFFHFKHLRFSGDALEPSWSFLGRFWMENPSIPLDFPLNFC